MYVSNTVMYPSDPNVRLADYDLANPHIAATEMNIGIHTHTLQTRSYVYTYDVVDTHVLVHVTTLNVIAELPSKYTFQLKDQP